MPDLQLLVGGQAHGGWNLIRVHRGLEEISGSFELAVSERWSASVPPLEVRAQDTCSVRADGETLITGAVDRASIRYDSNSHGVSVSGRDAAADLVDCSAEHSKGEWRNADIAQIARDLAKPYGIAVTTAGDLGAPFPAFAIEPGESVFECLERAARQRGVRLTSDGRGGLIVGNVVPRSSGAALVEGENILSLDISNDASQRYSDYRVLGQQTGTDDVNGAAAAQIKATSKDAGVKRYRPLVLVDEDQGDIAGFQRRAKWEASVRAARALTAVVHVQGWTHAGGLWHPNTLVRLSAPTGRIDRQLLVRDVDLVVDERGTIAELALVPPEAYTLAPPPESATAPGRRKHKRASNLEDVFS